MAPLLTGRGRLTLRAVEMSRRRALISNRLTAFTKLFSIRRRKASPKPSIRIGRKQRFGWIMGKERMKAPARACERLRKRRNNPGAKLMDGSSTGRDARTYG